MFSSGLEAPGVQAPHLFVSVHLEPNTVLGIDTVIIIEQIRVPCAQVFPTWWLSVWFPKDNNSICAWCVTCESSGREDS